MGHVKALENLDHRAIAEELVLRLTKLCEPKTDGHQSWKFVQSKEFLELTRGLYISRRISQQEYVFYIDSAVEGIFNDRLVERAYRDLEAISKSIQEIERSHGLEEGEYWLRGEGPPEWQKLHRKHEHLCRARHAQIFEELGFSDIAEIFADEKKIYRLRERGRRAVFHKDELQLALKDIVLRYEADARAAAKSGAYSSAITTLGAGIEGLLLLRCLRSPFKAERIARQLPPKLRPRLPQHPTTWTFETSSKFALRQGGW